MSLSNKNLDLDKTNVTEGSSADEAKGQNSRCFFNSLPDLVIQDIFNYLYWKEKIYAVEVFPYWERVLKSSLGWKRFENDRGYAHKHECLASNHYVLEEVTCIIQYGQYFSHCFIWIYNFLASDSPVDNDFSLLKYVELYCTRLKSLSIYHPSHLTTSGLSLSYVQYVLPLQSIMNSGNHVRLNLYRLLYRSVEFGTGIPDLLRFYQTNKLLRKIKSLDFSHGCNLAPRVESLNILMICTHLHILKCPIQNLNTTIIQQMLYMSLEELYLVNDDHTVKLSFAEKSSIRWSLLVTRPNCQFKVHYIFRNRTVHPVHICPNPYTRSLVLDSLCSSVSRALLRSIADIYSHSLQCLAFTFSEWMSVVPFSDQEDLASNFQYVATHLMNLKSVVLNLTIPCEAVIAIAVHSSSLINLLVHEHRIFFDGKTATSSEQLSSLKQIVSDAMGQTWSPISKDDSIYCLSSVRQNLLFEETVDQWEGFW